MAVEKLTARQRMAERLNNKPDAGRPVQDAPDGPGTIRIVILYVAALARRLRVEDVFPILSALEKELVVRFVVEVVR